MSTEMIVKAQSLKRSLTVAECDESASKRPKLCENVRVLKTESICLQDEDIEVELLPLDDENVQDFKAEPISLQHQGIQADPERLDEQPEDGSITLNEPMSMDFDNESDSEADIEDEASSEVEISHLINQ